MAGQLQRLEHRSTSVNALTRAHLAYSERSLPLQDLIGQIPEGAADTYGSTKSGQNDYHATKNSDENRPFAE